MTDTDTSKHGTDYVFAEIDAGDLGTFIIEDDGCDDADVRLVLMVEGDRHSLGLNGALSNARKDLGDGAFEARLNADGGAGGSSFEVRAPPSFRCDDCGKTWARPRNTNPGDGPDICPECDPDTEWTGF